MIKISPHYKIYDKRDEFSFPIVNFPFLDGDVPLALSYFHNSFAMQVSVVTVFFLFYFNERGLCITGKLLSQGFRYQKLIETFTKFFHRYHDLVLKIVLPVEILFQTL